MSLMTNRERIIRQRLKSDLEHYAPKCLRIRTKSGSIENLAFNRAQKYIHSRLEAQKDLVRLKSSFPNAILVPEKILVR